MQKHRMGAICLATLVASVAVIADETKVVYLSGKGKDDPVTWDFYCTGGRNSSTWTTIGVPSNWELQGFGSYNYGNDRKKADEQGKYRRTFGVPTDWTGKRIFLVFDGVMTDTEVWINGKSAGPKHQGGFYRFKYEITDLVKAGDNLLEVIVSKVSSDRSVEEAERQADYWVFGGIYRPVYLEAVPKQFIEWVAVDARADGTFQMDVHLNETGDADSVRVEIIGLGRPFEAKLGPDREKVNLQTQVQGHKTWTAETPNLYTVRVTLQQGGQSVHTVAKRFGFRTFEVRPGDGLYLNGQKIRLKGVCRHSFWPDSGRCLSKEISYADVRLIQEMNMNAVRMSHYPPDEHFLDACDELGLYVLDELAGWQKPPYDTEIGKTLVREMVTRDVCHPSILFWDNGNEGGWNRELDDQFALYDPQNRTVLHPWESIHGVDTAHYRNYEISRKKLSASTLYMPTEFLHGLYDGGLGAGLDDYWKLMYASPLGAGGFLWALLDEGVVRTDKGGQIDVAGNQAPDGIVGPYRQKEASFYTIKEIWSPMHIDLEALPPYFDGIVKVENCYDFTNLRDCRFEVELASFPGPSGKTSGHTGVPQPLRGLDIPPHQRGTLRLDLPADWRKADVLYLTAYNPANQVIWTWSWDIQGIGRWVDNRVVRQSVEQVAFQEVGHEIRVTAGDLALVLDGDRGLLKQVLRAGRQIDFAGGPRLIGGEGRVKQAITRRSNDGYSVQAQIEYDGNMRQAMWTIYPTGWISLDYEYELAGQFDIFGVGFDYPESKMRAMRFLGQGPYRVWKNRLKGGTLDVWSNKYKDDIPAATWDFPEFKGYYRDWRWVVFSTEQGDITIVNATPDLFLGVYRPNDGPAPANTKLNVPETGIALLHGIPAIGTKFDKPEVLGPQSQKNSASGVYRGTVWFHFGD
ncbi:MAG: glycoside hydrolase family 2 [Phycisphaerae bacterium]|nr:glycoside hydrolase family 2 [Phycisphaerae bacterium]